MSLILNDLFASLRDFQDVVPAVESSTTLAEMNSSALSAKKQICNIITKDIYDSICEVNDDPKPATYDALRSAMANATMSRQLIFDVMKLRKADKAVYKNELDAMRRGYTENYYNAMDTLLVQLEDNTDWQDTAYYKRRSTLKISTAEEFDALYPIDCSYLFFFRCMSLQEEILDDQLSAYFTRADDAEDDRKEGLISRLKRALAQLVVATALRRFDPQELPATIRNLHDDSTATRSADSEQSRLNDLSQQLFKSALDTIKNVDMIMSSVDAEDVDTGTISTEPDDKIILIA